MSKISAGLLMFRRTRGLLEVFLVHPGGPFWEKKDLGAWTIPKGLVGESEDNGVAARREFVEETGFAVTEPLFELGYIKQKSGKIVHAWAFEADIEPSLLKSNTFELEWPPKSGRLQSFPEIDRGCYFSLADARSKINEHQAEFLDRLKTLLGAEDEGPITNAQPELF